MAVTGGVRTILDLGASAARMSMSELTLVPPGA
jgi:hypothetical protein